MEEQSAFEEFDVKSNFVRRRSLLPVWIKIFTWFFLIGGAIAVLILICGSFLTNISLSLYGLETTEPYSLTGIFISSLFFFKGIVSYGLWFEEDWAIKVAKIDAILGFIIRGIVMIVLPFFTKHFMLRFELAVLIPYFLKLQKIEQNWKRI
ncbi:MAG: hypothetical protein WCJ72_07925 [Chryseobacterium sp.]